jgi:hypothetical protein
MRRLILVLLAFLLTGLLAAPVAAQAKEVERWQILTDQGDYVWDIRLVKLEGDALVYLQSDSTGRIGVDKISELRLIRKTTVRLEDAEGAGAATMSALTGGDDEVYDLSPLDFAARIRAIQQIFLRHPVSGN